VTVPESVSDMPGSTRWLVPATVTAAGAGASGGVVGGGVVGGGVVGASVVGTVVGAVVGAAVGAGIALLLAPRTGKEARTWLARNTREIKDAITALVSSASLQNEKSMLGQRVAAGYSGDKYGERLQRLYEHVAGQPKKLLL
jgi:gas vesicle protein